MVGRDINDDDEVDTQAAGVKDRAREPRLAADACEDALC